VGCAEAGGSPHPLGGPDPSTGENPKRERNEILLGLLKENTSEKFLSYPHKTGTGLGLSLKIFRKPDINIFRGSTRGEVRGVERSPETTLQGARGALENFAKC
jgi:hypothetical protein